MTGVTLDDLTEPAPDSEERPPLDRVGVEPTDATEKHWRTHGWVVRRKLIPDELIDSYEDAWRAVNDVKTGLSRWPACAYMHDPRILDLCLCDPLVEALQPLVGGDVGLHLNLTGWRSTRRDWHQDDYLNPPYVNSWYAAAWIALADVRADAGPFEFVDGSHKWPRLRRERILSALGLDETDPNWPAKTEEVLTPLVDAEIKRRGVTPKRRVLHRGDVLIWHGGLYHRGTVPKKPTMERRACIAHYSAVHKRTDMDPWLAHGNGFFYAHEQPLTEGSFAP